MGLLSRFRKKEDPVPGMLRQALGGDGFMYDQDEDGIYVFDYRGLGMALDMTEHPYVSVLYMDDDQCMERYGMSLEEFCRDVPEEMELSLDGSGDVTSLITGRPLLEDEWEDPEAFRALIERLFSISAELDALASRGA